MITPNRYRILGKGLLVENIQMHASHTLFFVLKNLDIRGLHRLTGGVNFLCACTVKIILMSAYLKLKSILGMGNAVKRSRVFSSHRIVVVVSAILLILGLLFAFLGADLLLKENGTIDCPPAVFVGVDVGYGNETDVYKTADAVKGYANLIIIGSLDVTEDTDALTRVCNYLYDKGFYMMVYVGYAEKGDEILIKRVDNLKLLVSKKE